MRKTFAAGLAAFAGLLIAATAAEARPLPPAQPHWDESDPKWQLWTKTRPPYEELGLTELAPNVFTARYGKWNTLIVVTPAGIVLSNPINTGHAEYMKKEFAKRWPKLKVKYVIYTHSYWDHDEGGHVFADTALFVAQERMLKNMDGRFPMMPGDVTDRNHDGNLDQHESIDPALEYPGICGSRTFAIHDKWGKGYITPKQFFENVVPPEITFKDKMNLSLGGEKIELYFQGLNHVDDGLIVYLPKEKIAFSADFPADGLVVDDMHSLPSACSHFDRHPIGDWVQSYKTFENLDFNILLQGHGTRTFVKQDVIDNRLFLEDLIAQVTRCMQQNMSLDEIVATVDLSKYKDWKYYDLLKTHVVKEAYYNLQIYP